jgi:hypothetical protein
MHKVIAAVLAAATMMQFAAPALAEDFFNRTTMLGWRQQSGPAVMAYVRAPLGPRTFKAPVRTGLAVIGPRSYNPGESPLYSQGPRALDFAFTRRDRDARWAAQLAAGNGVLWTNDEDSLQRGQVHLLESGMTWVAVGVISVGLVVATFAIIDADAPANATTSR